LLLIVVVFEISLLLSLFNSKNEAERELCGVQSHQTEMESN